MSLPRWAHPIRYLKETIGLYDDLIYTDMTKNKTVETIKRTVPEDSVGIDQMGMYQEDNCTFFYIIQDLPNFLHIDFKARLRRECDGDVTIAFLDKMQPHRIAWNSPEMQSKLRILRQNAEEMAEKEVNAFNMNSNLRDVRRNEWIQESLQYLSEAEVDRNRSLYRVQMLMIISGTRGEVFDHSVVNVEKYAEQLGIRLHRVLYNIPEVLAFFSPWGSAAPNVNTRFEAPAFVLSDEILARFNTYTQGTLGYRGICFGTDIYSHFPVLKQVKQSATSAENWLITAETGGGKSYFIKAIILQLLTLGYNGTIMDIEGYEYLPLARILRKHSNVKVINMAEGQGGYFDPVEIPVYNGLDVEDQTAMRHNATEFTLSMLRVLLGKAYEENNYMSVVIDDAVSQTYSRAGVTDDMYTWGLSANLTLFSVYATMKTLYKYRDMKPYHTALDEALAILSKYFEPGGTRSAMFQNRVAINDIIDADLVVCSFGMAGKSQDSIDQAQLALMQLGAAQLSHQRSIFSKTKGRFNFKLWEEFQRWGKFPGSEKTLGTALTGGRKLGDVNIIITNVVAELLGEDKFNIFSNITSFLAGTIGDSKVRTELCERLSVPNMLPELDAIGTVRDSNDESDKSSERHRSPYEFSFLCGLDKSKYAIVRMDLPPNLRESELFKTGVNTDIDELQERL